MDLKASSMQMEDAFFLKPSRRVEELTQRIEQFEF